MKTNDKKVKSLYAFTARFESIFCILFLIVFSLLIIKQITIFIPLNNSSVLRKDVQNGEPIGKEEYLYDERQITLTLVDFVNYPALKVLVNGEERASFLGKSVDINVIEGDVIELDGSATNTNTSVQVSPIGEHSSETNSTKIYIVGKEVLKILSVS